MMLILTTTFRKKVLLYKKDVKMMIVMLILFVIPMHSSLFATPQGTPDQEGWENFGQIPAGHILLQDHGNTAHFRSIKIREF